MKISNSLSFIKENNLKISNYIASSLYSSIYNKIREKENITFHYYEENPSSDLIFFYNIKFINPKVNIIYYPKSKEGYFINNKIYFEKIKIFEKFDCSTVNYFNFSTSIDKKNKTIYFQHNLLNPHLNKYNKFPFEVKSNSLNFLETNIYSINKKDFSNNIFKTNNSLALKDNLNIYFHLLDLKTTLLGKNTFSFIQKDNIKNKEFCYINKNIPKVIKNKLIELNKNTKINPEPNSYLKENHYFSGEVIKESIKVNNFYKLGQYVYLEIYQNHIPKDINFLSTKNNLLYIENIKKIDNNIILLKTSLVK